MEQEQLKKLYDWYYTPGEVLRSIGFYVNPYNQWQCTKFRHIFAFDAQYNLYVGQYSVYLEHIDKIFDLDDKREHGMLFPKDTSPRLIYSDIEQEMSGITSQAESILDYAPVVFFDFLETRNINYLNVRLRHIAQRLFDYGMPLETVFISKQTDLWFPTIKSITKGKLLKRPTKQWLLDQLVAI